MRKNKRAQEGEKLNVMERNTVTTGGKDIKGWCHLRTKKQKEGGMREREREGVGMRD